jgi:WD40 repeat protein
MSAFKRFLASGGMDGMMRVWSLTTCSSPSPAARLATSYVFDAHESDVFTVAWSPNGRLLASGGRDQTVQVWDVETGDLVMLYEGHKDAVYAVAWSPDSTTIASGGRDQTVQVWDVETGEPFLTYYGHAHSVYALAWSSDGTRIASGSRDKTVQVWDPTSGDLVFIPPSPAATTVYAVAWSPQDRFLAVASRGVNIYLWKRDEEWNKEWGMFLSCYEGHAEDVYAVAWSPDGKYIASAGFDKTVQVWEFDSARLLLTYADHLEYVRAVAWSPAGELIASASRDGTVQVWDPTSGRTISAFRDHDRPVYTVAWSPSAAQETPLEDALPEVNPLSADEDVHEVQDENVDPPRSTGQDTASFSPPPYSLPRAVYRLDLSRTVPDTGQPVMDEPFGGMSGPAMGPQSVYEWTSPPSPFTPGSTRFPSSQDGRTFRQHLLPFLLVPPGGPMLWVGLIIATCMGMGVVLVLLKVVLALLHIPFGP